MTLAELLRASPPRRTVGRLEARVGDLRHDSRHVRAGDVFFALKGAKTDGGRHALEALSRGAVAVVSEDDPPSSALPGAWIQVDDAVRAMALCADSFFGHPSGAMTVVGVTGTNGKTTTTYLLESAVAAMGGVAGVVGTIEYRLGGRLLEKAANTTPISLELTRLLARFRDGGATHALMEVSSHALALQRADTVDFDAGIFLNLTRDHLDFHRTTEAYFAAKARLFDLLARPSNPKPRKVAALNADDPRAAGLRERAAGCGIVLFGLGPQASDLRGRIVSADLNGSRFAVDWRGSRWEGSIRLPGPHNVSNALAAAAALLGLGAPPDRVLEGLSSLKSVPGRLEPVDVGQDFHVFVDFAHTDSALETVLRLLRGLTHGRLITVFGCGGDRDRTKRGPMGVAACRSSDLAIVTSDNPRGEDPLAIVADVEAGIRAAGLQNYRIIPDRGEAVVAAIREAAAGDVVLIAGKGHERDQILRDRVVPFDDREAARAALRAMRSASQ